MAIIIDSFVQGSAEWELARSGTPGGSGISKIITTKGDRSKQRDEYLMQLAAEQVAGHPEDGGYISSFMANGKAREEASRLLFEMMYGVEVRQVGIVYKDEWKLFHYSPDGLIGDSAILEMKNPMMKTHVKSLLDGTLPTEYFSQCQMGLYVCERELCYFMSNYHGLPPLVVEVKRDEPFIAKMAKALDEFSADLMAMVNKLKAI